MPSDEDRILVKKNYLLKRYTVQKLLKEFQSKKLEQVT